jgi:predicted protein tyrosine phosphatase
VSAIAVCPLSQLDTMLNETGSDHIISLLSGDMEFNKPKNIAEKSHLLLRFNDIAEAREGLVLPGKHHMLKIIQFAEKWDRKNPLLIHCWAGISRSPAAAAIVALALKPEQNEQQLATSLRKLAAAATPNIKMIGLADDLLQRNGKLIRAMENIGRGEDAFEGTPFQLTL